MWVRYKVSSPYETLWYKRLTCFSWGSEWVINFGIVDIRIHVVHTSSVVITYTLESLFSLTQITHNLQVTKNFKIQTNLKKAWRKDNILQQGPKSYWEKRMDGSLMLATIHDDTWNMLNMQCITPNLKRWDYSDIPSGGHKNIEGPTHMVEGGHHFKIAPSPHPL